jgi:ABC-type sugar transport system substrate-binding protein
MRASAPADTGCYWVEAAIISYEACRQRKAGFKKALSAKVPGVRYFADQPGFLTDEARTTAAEIITAKANVDALYAANEGGTVGALKGIQATRHAGRTVVLGSDISAQIAEAMLAQRKTLVLTVGQGAQRMRRVAVQQALRAVRGEQIAQFDTYISTREFTSANPQGLRSWLAAHKDACRRCGGRLDAAGAPRQTATRRAIAGRAARNGPACERRSGVRPGSSRVIWCLQTR